MRHARGELQLVRCGRCLGFIMDSHAQRKCRGPSSALCALTAYPLHVLRSLDQTRMMPWQNSSEC